MNSSPSIDVSLAELFGVTALVISFLISRVSDSEALLSTVKYCRKYLNTGFESIHISSLLYSCATIVFVRMISIIVALLSFYHTFYFIYVVDWIVGKEVSIDLAHSIHLLSLSEKTKDLAISYSIYGTAGFVLDWILSLYARWTKENLPSLVVPEATHVHAIPRNWEAAPAAQWEERIEEILAIDYRANEEMNGMLIDGSWRTDWKKWSECVSAYRAYSMKKFATTSERY